MIAEVAAWNAAAGPRFNVVAVQGPTGPLASPMEGKSAALSDAEKRVIEIKTEAGDPVIYSGNPAELSGARFEMRKAMRRAGAFKLLVSMNASRLPNGTICVEDLDMVPLVTNLIVDPHGGWHTTRRGRRVVGGTSLYIRLGGVLARSPLVLGFKEAEINCFVVMRVGNHGALRGG